MRFGAGQFLHRHVNTSVKVTSHREEMFFFCFYFNYSIYYSNDSIPVVLLSISIFAIFFFLAHTEADMSL